ncbi:MAG: hypothetical protein JWP26_4426 [Devosia sp.]|uniref:DUF3592 domain-containing protein n=1 Tax=Devosia sp. TaxID=1871048 RepID=UPI0026085DE0|nr:DUF3592 domain-containing protein [Devosia sp.]MDB5589456.1 hypothetical protein [Devosia sp.]
MELKWFLFAILMAMDGLVMVAAVTKYIEVKRASIWAAVPGRVTASRSEARTVDKSSGSGRDRVVDTEIRNFATVAYEFHADGRKQTGNRISIAHDVGNYQVAEKLAKYPVGAKVTVFYDRNKPNDNVLEREMSMRGFEITFLIGALVAAVAVLAMLLTEDVGAIVAQYVPQNGRTSGGIFVTVMAGFMALFANAIYQRGQATFTWPKVEGVVATSGVDKVRSYYLRGNGITYYWYLFRSRTVYDYRVNGVEYKSDRASYGAQTYASFTLLAKREAERFVPGDSVDVYYDPKSPERAVLVRGAPGQWLVWVVAVALFALAARLIGLI